MRNMEEQIQKDLEDLKTLLLHDNLFNYALLKKSIVMGKLGIIFLGDFQKDPMGQTRHAIGYLTLGRKLLDLDVYYVPYSRTVRVCIGRVNFDIAMDEVRKLLEDEGDEDEE